MPRRRTSNRPLKRRIKLETARDIQDEMGKRYRAMQHGDALRSDVSKDVYVLDKLRAGLPEVKAENGSGNGYSIPGFTILSMPTNHFLTGEQITALKRGEPIVDVRKCTPLLLESEPTSPALLAPESIENQESREVETLLNDVVVAFQARMRGRDDSEPAA